MTRNNTANTCVIFLCLGISNTVSGMGLRSFVALPVEKGGAVARLTLEHAKKSDTNNLLTSIAYGLSSSQTLLLGLPYRISSPGNNRQGDIAVLYRHITWQEDSLSGTNRLGLLGGITVPTKSDRDPAIQAGFVLTHFKNRHEIDIDALYQAGLENRIDSGRYDLSWQYRLLPAERQNWGISQELNSVLELNGRWNEGNKITHQFTVGLQWIHQKMVIDGGISKDLNNSNETRYIISVRFHL